MERVIDRIDHMIWVVRPENIAGYVEQASKLFNVEFERLHGPTVTGFDRDAYVSWPAGLEFVAPLGTGDPVSQALTAFLEEKGEGFWGFVFGVDNLEASLDRARGEGFEIGEVVQSSDPAVRRAHAAAWSKHVVDVLEARAVTFLGTEVLFGEMYYAGDKE